MSDIALSIEHVTKNYGKSRGNFDINLDVKKGETVIIIGENGAGKTTLLRQIMGFIKSDEGKITVLGYDAHKLSDLTKNFLAYIPGEINFPDVKSGAEFIREIGGEIGLKEENYKKADEIIKRMQLDVTAYPRRMSKGMKQKTAIVLAFMRNYPILIMDEPTTGLDPLMRDEFLRLVQEEKEKGTTIIMTTNTIEEAEKVADRVVFLTEGKIIQDVHMDEINHSPYRYYKIEFTNDKDYTEMLELYKNEIIRIQPQYKQISVKIDKKDITKLIRNLSDCRLKFFSQIPYTLQNYFDESKKRIGGNANG